MIDYFKAVLAGQFEASLCMLDRCVRRCPDEHWEGRIGNRTFSQVAYHTLYFVDLYLSPCTDAFEPRDFHRRAGGKRLGAGGSLTRDDTLAYLALCRRKAVETLAGETSASLRGPSGFVRLPFSRGETHLYNIRHVQHHTGQLSAYLRRVADDGKGWWVKSGWR